MKTVVIARHAKSDWGTGVSDFDRPLNPRGKKDAPMMGKMLAQNGFSPDLIISSPAMRAKMTAEAVAEQLGYSRSILFDRNLYDEGDAYEVSLLRKLPTEAQTVMVFGHNPTQESVVELLLGMNGPGSVTMPTGAMTCMQSYADSWADVRPGSFNLLWHIIPKAVKKSFLK